jgi:hypothetical protein
VIDMRGYVFASCLLLSAGCVRICPTLYIHGPPVPKPTATVGVSLTGTEASADSTDESLCRASCARMVELGCPEGSPVSTGDKCYLDRDCAAGQTCIDKSCQIPCETFCNESQAAGVRWSTSCLQQISSCAEVDVCMQE